MNLRSIHHRSSAIMTTFPKRSRFKRCITRIFFVISSIVVALLAAEIFTRIFVPRYVWEFVTANHYWQSDATLGWVQKPSFDIITAGESNRPVRFRTNPDGVFPHTARPQRSLNLKRIMIFGDSTVVGRLIPQNLSIAGQLQHSLEALGIRAEVICAGVEGYGADQSLLRMIQLVPEYRPDLILFGSCENDFSENETDHNHGFWKPHFNLKQDGGLELIPRSHLSDPPQLDSGWRALLRHSALYRVTYPKFAGAKSRLEGNPERFSSSVMQQNLDPERVDRFNWKLATAIWRQMAGVAETNHSEFLFYAHPSYYEVWDNSDLPPSLDRHALEKRYVSMLREEKIHFCPMVDYFRRNRSRGPFHIPMNPHCNSRGYELTAEALATYIRNEHLLE